MTNTITKQITFKSLMAEMKKYAPTNNQRKILNYVYFDGENFIATNSHVLLKVNKEYISNIPSELEKGNLINPSTLEIVKEYDSKYPNIERVFPQYCNLNIRLNESLDEMISYVKSDNKLLKGKALNKLYHFNMNDDYIEIRAIQRDYETQEKEELSQHIMKHRWALQSDKVDYNIYMQSKYITNALNSVKKFGKLSDKDIEFKVIGNMRPIMIEQQGVFSILVLPVRMY